MGQASIPSFCLYIHIHQYIQIVKYHLPGNKPPPEGCQENAHAQQSEKTFIFSERLPYHTPALDRLGQALFAHAMTVFILGRTMLIQVKHCTVVLAWHEFVLFWSDGHAGHSRCVAQFRHRDVVISLDKLVDDQILIN